MLTQSSRRRQLSRRLTAVLGASAVLATAACTGGSDSSGGSSSDGGTGASDATIALSIQAQPASLDPSLLQEGQQGYIWGSIFDTLLYLDNDGQVQPNAAESWEYSEDLKTLTLTLREGMTFTTGDPVTAEAARATLERTRTTAGPLQSRLESVTSVEAPDDRTVVIGLDAPDAGLLIALATGAGVIGDPATFDAPETALDPVGSGAYELDDAATSVGSTYVLKRRDDYWNVDAYPFETVTVRVIADATAQFNALLGGQLDAGRINPDQEQQASGAGFTVSDLIPTASATLLLLDRDGAIVPAMADVRVRQAINLALDREGFSTALLQGNAQPTEQFFSPQGPAYVEDLAGTYDFDPDRARDLMAEAGYADGFSMTLPSTVFSTTFEPTVTQALGDIGIDVTWEPQPPQSNLASIQSGKYPAAFWFEGLDPAPRQVQGHYTTDATINPFHTDFSEIEGLLADAASTTDEDQQRDAYQQIGTIAVEEALDAPIAYVGTRWATADGVEYLQNGANVFSTIRAFGVSS
ncbi:ABC transporter substrate-binding protein [Blastococcus sp. URHD0036]|uniref:ABC transporter substrate-binding protein n=1 Tax=Blastococcus sp. URHD0036 TaxID=1380356 RepID=UPI0004950417|nr:ABC transporter substrate-binding protein [Blastococcus sp. URHD0036]